MATAYCQECKAYGHYSSCKTAAQAELRKMKASTTEQYTADAQLQRDIEAARGVKPEQINPLKRQEGGSHYTKLKIQPMEYSMANSLNAGQHTVIKYVTRYKDKGGVEDLRKAIHTLELMIELEQRKFSLG